MDRNNWKPEQGDNVWIYYFNPHNREGNVTAGVYPRTFEKTIPNYLNRAGDLRWVLLLPGKPFNLGYGTAFKPDKVYQSEGQALHALQRAIHAKIDALEHALAESHKGKGVA